MKCKYRIFSLDGTSFTRDTSCTRPRPSTIVKVPTYTTRKNLNHCLLRVVLWSTLPLLSFRGSLARFERLRHDLGHFPHAPQQGLEPQGPPPAATGGAQGALLHPEPAPTERLGALVLAGGQGRRGEGRHLRARPRPARRCVLSDIHAFTEYFHVLNLIGLGSAKKHRHVLACALRIKPSFPPIDIQHAQFCPC